MTAPAPVLARLRAATADAHRELEDRLNIVECLSTLAGRRAMVPRYYRMHSAAEAAVWPHLRAIADLDIGSRSRIDMLTRDLAVLDIERPDEVATPPVHGVAEALGLLYVIEGSTLGGRTIGGMLKTRGSDLTGLTFLDPYTSRTGQLWRGFLGVMERESAGDIGGVERGAIAGFAHARACLLGNEG